MKINLEAKIKDITTGKIIKDGDNTDKDFTLKRAIVTATTNAAEGSNAEAKYKLYELTQRVVKATNEIELSTEEIVSIKERIGALYGVVVVGQCYDLLEGKA